MSTHDVRLDGLISVGVLLAFALTNSSAIMMRRAGSGGRPVEFCLVLVLILNLLCLAGGALLQHHASATAPLNSNDHTSSHSSSSYNSSNNSTDANGTGHSMHADSTSGAHNGSALSQHSHILGETVHVHSSVVVHYCMHRASCLMQCCRNPLGQRLRLPACEQTMHHQQQSLSFTRLS